VKTAQILAIVFIAILVINIILLALKLISDTLFWIIIALGFIASYVLKKTNQKKRVGKK